MSEKNLRSYRVYQIKMEKILKALDILALIMVFSFTICMTAIAVVMKGALLYFYEPHILMLSVEVILGCFACIWVLYLMKRIFSEIVRLSRNCF
jgi:hypothetical protein